MLVVSVLQIYLVRNFGPICTRYCAEFTVLHYNISEKVIVDLIFSADVLAEYCLFLTEKISIIM